MTKHPTEYEGMSGKFPSPISQHPLKVMSETFSTQDSPCFGLILLSLIQPGASLEAKGTCSPGRKGKKLP